MTEAPSDTLMTAPSGTGGPLDSDGSRRHLTLLFCDLSDSVRLGELMEAEDYAGLLASFRSLSREIILRHGGHIARMQGDGVLALFGHPTAREDDGRRATEAALELHAAVGALPARDPGGAR
jgi:class 3 adenylate cyclase